MRKSIKALTAMALVGAGTLLAHPAPALAAAYSPEAACAEESGRSGWRHISDNKRAVKHGGTTYGHVYLMWHGGLKKNCVVTIKTAFSGTATYTTAKLWVKGRSKAYTDSGKYRYYAAVIASAGGKCVKYQGTTRDTRVDFREAKGGRSSWGNCG